MIVTSSPPATPIRPVGSAITLTCIVELSLVVDVSVTVNTMWTGPSGFVTTNTAQLVMGSTPTYASRVFISSLRSDQSGVYSCVPTITSQSSFVTNSSSQNTSASTSIGITHHYMTVCVLRTNRCFIHNYLQMSFRLQ